MTAADVIFLAGLAAAVTGCWMCGTAAGVIGSGVGTCVIAVAIRRQEVLARVRAKRK